MNPNRIGRSYKMIPIPICEIPFNYVSVCFILFSNSVSLALQLVEFMLQIAARRILKVRFPRTGAR